MDQSVINFAVYEDSKEYVGMAKVTLPDLTSLTQAISGAGIAGNMDFILVCSYEENGENPELLMYKKR